MKTKNEYLELKQQYDYLQKQIEQKQFDSYCYKYYSSGEMITAGIFGGLFLSVFIISFLPTNPVQRIVIVMGLLFLMLGMVLLANRRFEKFKKGLIDESWKFEKH